MSNREKTILDKAQLDASRMGARLFRNNVGSGWVGRIVGNKADTITLLNPRPLHAGLCKGSSDLIGWTPVVVTPEMVGKTVAVFTAIEGKTKGVRTTLEQSSFLTAVTDAGGIGSVLREGVEVRDLLHAGFNKAES